MCVNDMAFQFKERPVTHAVSQHPELLEAVKLIGPLRGIAPITHSTCAGDGVDHVWGKLKRKGGTSSIFALKIALVMGYKKIVVCGVPLDDSGHYYDPEYRISEGSERFDYAHNSRPFRRLLKDKTANSRVRGMSGHFKRPTKEWLIGE
jgi:hypothetical protein